MFQGANAQLANGVGRQAQTRTDLGMGKPLVVAEVKHRTIAVGQTGQSLAHRRLGFRANQLLTGTGSWGREGVVWLGRLAGRMQPYFAVHLPFGTLAPA